MLLIGEDEPVCPAKQMQISYVVTFKNWSELHNKLHGFSPDPEPEPKFMARASEPEISSFKQPETEATSTESPNLNIPVDEVKERAAIRVQLMWRRSCVRRDRAATSDYSPEGLCYENLKSAFLEMRLGKNKKDNMLRKVLRGPNLSVILALEALGEQLQELLEETSYGLQEPGIDANAIEALQSRQKKLQCVFKSVLH